MCGIIGYVGSRECKPLLLQGLERLEYRGYDSAGIALREEHGLEYVRAVGNLQRLKEAAGPNGSRSTHGLGHTRWATHGGVTERNAHPLTGCDEAKLAVVLNGIVENYRELRRCLREEGHEFTSETDAEVVAHMVERHYEGDLLAAVTEIVSSLSEAAVASSPANRWRPIRALSAMGSTASAPAWRASATCRSHNASQPSSSQRSWAAWVASQSQRMASAGGSSSVRNARTALALVEAPDGIGYIVKQGDTLGDGTLTDIGLDSVVFAVAAKPGAPATRVVLRLLGN